MADTDNEDHQLLQMLSRYMSDELAEQLLGRREALESEESKNEPLKEITVLYIHAHNSDEVIAPLRPYIAVELLNDYMEGIVSAIFEYKGTVDKYIGADILAVFGAPLPLKDHAWMAVQAALEINQRVQESQRTSTLAGQLSMNVSIGIHSGQVFIGGTTPPISAAIMDVINKDAINQAVRLSKLGQTYNCSILITESTRFLLNDQLPTKEVGTVSLALKDNATKIYQLVSDRI